MLFVQIQHATNVVWKIDAEGEIIYNCTITKATTRSLFLHSWGIKMWRLAISGCGMIVESEGCLWVRLLGGLWVFLQTWSTESPPIQREIGLEEEEFFLLKTYLPLNCLHHMPAPCLVPPDYTIYCARKTNSHKQTVLRTNRSRFNSHQQIATYWKPSTSHPHSKTFSKESGIQQYGLWNRG